MLPDRIVIATEKTEILLVEDNPAEARLIKELLEEAEWGGRLHVG